MENQVENRVIISREIKEKIISQYWGLFVMRLPNNDDTLKVMDWFNFKNCYLSLKPLSKIQDSEVIDLLKFINDDECEYELDLVGSSELHKIWNIKTSEGDNLSLTIHFSDCDFELSRKHLLGTTNILHLSSTSIFSSYQYLQGLGYALPFEKYSVEQLIDAGIYELKK